MAKADEVEMDTLAEHVSRHGSIGKAARAMKIAAYRAEFLWHRICARLGSQAR